MKILIYSDLHLEFGEPWTPPSEDAGDVLVLAGDIVAGKVKLLSTIFDAWSKPIIYVAGNHEYYTRRTNEMNAEIRDLIENYYDQVHFLLDEPCTIDGVQFFGGTMWTDFDGADWYAMKYAQEGMADYRAITNPDGSRFMPQDSVNLHEEFVAKFRYCFGTSFPGPRVVVTHHAPVLNPNSRFKRSPLVPAFNSLDMVDVIDLYQPNLWVYGHTHECDDQVLGTTRVLSNQRGYPRPWGGFESVGFREDGVGVEV